VNSIKGKPKRSFHLLSQGEVFSGSRRFSENGEVIRIDGERSNREVYTALPRRLDLAAAT
jgi:hypothetical protein